MQSQVYEGIEEVARRIADTQGVIGVALFGSYARGDFDEGSDVDLLVVFRSRDELDRGMRRIHEVTARVDLFFQVVSMTSDEFSRSPLLDSVLREGRFYFGEERMRKLARPRKPYALITYSTANLSPKERALTAQRLEGRRSGRYRYEGFIQQLGGYKVGRGVAMIPAGELRGLADFLDKKKIQYVTRFVWV